MVWDYKTPAAITLARLKVAPPEVVYQALCDYGSHVADGGRFNLECDEALEQALLDRSDPLIDLGLALYGAFDEVVVKLYRNALAGSGDSAHDKGIRLACLSSRIMPLIVLHKSYGGVENSTELLRLATFGDLDELDAMLKNPAAGGILRTIYHRKRPFDTISDDRHLELIRASIGNPRVNVDESNTHGPDLLAWDLQRGIFNLLVTAPLQDKWVRHLFFLLTTVDPRYARLADGDLQQVLDRWNTVAVKNLLGNTEEDEKGWLTSLTLAKEFQCLIATLYGKKLGENQFIVLGGPDDLNVVSRCAWYGNARLTPEQMNSGFQRDGDVFVFAALLNDNLYYKPECRVVLEEIISGDFIDRYSGRCKQIHQHTPNFDPTPISDRGTELMDAGATPSEEMSLLSRLDAKVSSLEKNVGRISTVVLWGFILVAVLVFVRR